MCLGQETIKQPGVEGGMRLGEEERTAAEFVLCAVI